MQMNPEDFFGPYYYDNPANFEFARGEKKKIKSIATHVNSIIKNFGLTEGVQHFSQIEKKTNDNLQKEPVWMQEETTKTQYLLNLLNETADSNALKKPGGYRYCQKIQMFASLLRMVSGPLAYELIQSNLPGALPSIPTTNRYIRKSHCNIIEGVLRLEELSIYLNDRNLEKTVAIAEDATRIIGRVQFDSRTNSLMGFALPLNEQTGMPIPFTYKARNAHEIAKHMLENDQNPGYVNVVMAKPISTIRVPAFCLLIYSTQNDYDSRDVAQRWTFINNELKKVGIKAISFSSDADPKNSCAMRSLSSLGIQSKYFVNFDWFSCGNKQIGNILPVFVQDTTHLVASLRNRMLKTINTPDLLPFGKYHIQQSHLQFLLDNFSKDKHNLTATIINPIDRQNFEQTVLRLCDEKVTNLLRSSVIGSEATTLFLEMIRGIIAAFMDTKLTPIERIENMWYIVFMLRIWRNDILMKKKLTVKDNFISPSSYVCIELNAHSLVLLILHLRETNQPQHFLPHLLNSQSCEGMFRQVRSFTSTYSTMANCSVKEILSRMSKIEYQNEISFSISPSFKIPRLAMTSGDGAEKQAALPDERQIVDQIEKCKQNAIKDALRFGLIKQHQVKSLDFSCKILPYAAKSKKKENVDTKTNVMRSKSYLKLLTNTSLTNYAYKFDGKILDETSPYVELPSIGFNRFIVKKTSLCWLLRRDFARISTDRLERVRFLSRNMNKSNLKRIKRTGKFSFKTHTKKVTFKRHKK